MSAVGASAIGVLRDAVRLRAGERVLVRGANGGVGTATTCFTAALAAFERGGRERDIGVTLTGLGEAVIAGGRETEAATRLRQACQLLSAEKDRYDQARARAALGRGSGPGTGGIGSVSGPGHRASGVPGR